MMVKIASIYHCLLLQGKNFTMLNFYTLLHTLVFSSGQIQPMYSLWNMHGVGKMERGWTGMPFYILFYCISFQLIRWEGCNDRLWIREPHLQLGRFALPLSKSQTWDCKINTPTIIKPAELLGLQGTGKQDWGVGYLTLGHKRKIVTELT